MTPKEIKYNQTKATEKLEHQLVRRSRYIKLSRAYQ